MFLVVILGPESLFWSHSNIRLMTPRVSTEYCGYVDTGRCGESAIFQSLAERLSEASKLGATLFFFSRPNERDNLSLVIPTVAYRLAVRIPPYKEYLRQIMVNNPKLLEKDVEGQFKTLIIEPFIRLKLTNETRKWGVLLDGLDEC